MDRNIYPWLVQRVIYHELKDGRSGIDSHFGFSYMGSSEFEFGALPNSLKLMRKNHNLAEPKRIKADGQHVCWYVGREEEYGRAVDFFEDQLNRDFKIIQERTRIREAYGLESAYGEDIHAWWNVDAGDNPRKAMQPWLIFKNKAHAKKWLELM